MSKAKAPESKSNTPILIIVGVLVIAALGGWWFYSTSSSKPSANANTANANANKANKSTIPANAPIGANPPNQSGSPTALVKLEEFADFQCPQCGTMHPL